MGKRHWGSAGLTSAPKYCNSRKATVSNERQLGDSGSGVRERRRSLAAHDRRGLVYEIVVLKGLDHE